MDIDSALVAVVVLSPFLLIGGAVVAVALWKLDVWNPSRLNAMVSHGERDRIADDAAILGVWLLLTALSLWAGVLLAYFALHGLYFAFGSGVAAVGLVVSVAGLVALPIAWAVVIWRRTHHAHGHHA